MLQQHGWRLIEFDGLLNLDRSYMTIATNILLQEEKMFNTEQQAHINWQMKRTLNLLCQQDAFE